MGGSLTNEFGKGHTSPRDGEDEDEAEETTPMRPDVPR